MEQRTENGLSPYLTLTREEWAALREDTPMTLTADEVTRVRSLHDRLDMKEVEEIYLPVWRRRSDCSSCSSTSSARQKPRCPTSSALRARSRSENRPRHACCRRCSRA